jgi:Fur family iron response transcriptional regulator
LLFEGGNRHVTAEILHVEAQTAEIRVSLATVYNTLHQFTAVGLLREIVVDSQRCYFDTNISDHHHFFYENSGRLEDIPGEEVVLARLPEAPTGAKVTRVDVVIRVLED